MGNWNGPPGPPGYGPPPAGGFGGPPAGGFGGPPPGGYGAPPAGGFGAPTGVPVYGFGAQPYGPTTYEIPKGNLWLGLLAGFFGGCIGIALVFVLAKGPDTKKGAAIGFGASIAIGVVGNVLALMTG